MRSTAASIPTSARGHDRRAHERYVLTQEIRIVHDARSLVAFTEDISVGGACLFLENGARVRVGDTIRCFFALSNLDEELCVKAEVRWVKEGACQCVGAQFSEPLRPYVIFALF